MTDTQRTHLESGTPKMTKIATALQQAYPESVSAEVTQLLTNFNKLPTFSQDVAKKVLAAIPTSTAANDEKFALAA